MKSNKMKAAVYTNYGSPDVLQLRDIKTPAPNDNELLIRVFATTVNRTDCAMLRAKPFIMRFFTGLLKPKSPILGTDFAGQVEGVGKNITSFKVGDKVFGFDDQGLESHAQYMTISKEKAIAVMPQNISYEQAAASTEGVHYAYNFINKVTIKRGQNILVNGATGAIGSALIQLLKNLDLNVTAVANTENIELVKSMGVEKVIDYTQRDFTKDDTKFDFIFDAVGKSSFIKCKPLLVPGGIYISSELGWMAQNIFLAIITPIITKIFRQKGGRKVIIPIPSDCRRTVLYIKKLCEEGKFKAVIDRDYPLEKIAEAFRYVETGQKTGNVIVTMENNNTFEN
jgi:NADPH:quinone reductase-like Zn-dependent oxidoreductase